jgi:hypothetical protein
MRRMPLPLGDFLIVAPSDHAIISMDGKPRGSQIGDMNSSVLLYAP